MSGERVLVTGGAFTGGLAALRALRSAGYRPWASVSRTAGYAAFTRSVEGRVTVPDPAAEPHAFVARLAAAAARESIDVLLPGTETALHALAQHRSLFPAGLAVGVPDMAIVDEATDKEALQRIAAAAGVETPPTTLHERAELIQRASRLVYPVIVKPLRSSLQRGGVRVHSAPARAADETELLHALAQVEGETIILQPYLDGTLRAISGVAWQGNTVVTVQQAADRIWPPLAGISAYARTVERNPESDAVAARIVSALRWSGIFQLQFLERAGVPYLIDVNPRIYGSLALAVSAGANLPAIWTELLLGREPAVGEYRVGVGYRAEENDVRAIVALARSGRPADALRAALPRRGTTHAVGRLTDPLPVLASAAKMVRRPRPVRTRVLVTGGEHIGPLGAIRALDAAGYEVWATTHGAGSYAEHSRACAGVVVVQRDEGFVDAVRNACAEHGLRGVLPGVERDLVLLAEARDLFPPEVRVGAPPGGAVARATDKEAMSELFERAGLDIPPTLATDDVGKLRFPVVAKPHRSESRTAEGRLVHAAPRVVADAGELREALDSFPDGGVVQPFLSDRIYAVCGVAWEGRLVCSEHQASSRIFPRDAGMVSHVETVERDADLDVRVGRVVAELGWSGIFQIQFLVAEDRLYAIDLNPRIYISLSLAVAAGMNLPAIWCDLLLEREPRIGDYRVGMRWRNDEDDPRAIIGHLRAGAVARGLAGIVPRPSTTHAVFSLSDPGPARRSAEKLLSRARAARGTAPRRGSSPGP